VGQEVAEAEQALSIARAERDAALTEKCAAEQRLTLLKLLATIEPAEDISASQALISN